MLARTITVSVKDAGQMFSDTLLLETEYYFLNTYTENTVYVYMESRKMALKNLFTGQQWRNKENRLMDIGKGEERVRCMERATRKLTFPYVNR